MYINNIKISKFRNYDTLDINFNKEINIIYGKNGQGKTNLLESIYVLGMTKSHRSFIDNDLIKDNNLAAKISGQLINKNIPTKLEIIINKKEKKLFIDKDKISRNSDYISNMNVIIFYPDDLDLIKGSPNIRRRYLNLEISQLDSTYIIIFNDFNKILKIRNEYLKKINNNENYDQNYFNIINDIYIEKASLIYKMRYKYIEKINDYCTKVYNKLANIDNFKLLYKPIVNFSNYDLNNIKLQLKEKLDAMLKVEIKLKNTIIGPHRDDFLFLIDDIDLKKYGSQGQQRMAVLSIKLSEIEILKKYKQTTPILLLDDVFSELDSKKKNNLLKYIKKSIQTIITTTDLALIDQKIINNAKLIEIQNGTIKKIREVKKNDKK